MQIIYDKIVDAMFIKLNEKLIYKSSKKISDDILVDYSEDGKVIGVEVLTASRNTLLPLPKSSIPIDFSPS